MVGDRARGDCASTDTIVFCDHIPKPPHTILAPGTS